MAKSKEGISCKAYTLTGIHGGEITIAETIDRRSIRITALGTNCIVSTLFITAEQFETLCGFDSSYDGLEVKAVPPEPEGAGPVRVPKHQAELAEEPEADPVVGL